MLLFVHCFCLLQTVSYICTKNPEELSFSCRKVEKQRKVECYKTKSEILEQRNESEQTGVYRGTAGDEEVCSEEAIGHKSSRKVGKGSVVDFSKN